MARIAVFNYIIIILLTYKTICDINILKEFI